MSGPVAENTYTVGLASGSWLDVDDTCMVRALEDGWLAFLKR